MNDYISLALYLFTFGAGLFIRENNKKISRLYVIWLYVFLCFGYMTGSDWRAYEMEYYQEPDYWMYVTEPFSLFLLKYTHYVIPDFLLFLGLTKCLYFWSALRVVEKITNKKMATIAVLLHLLLVFMLISNPLRFMWAMIPVNIALGSIVASICSNQKVRWQYIYGLLIISVLFHNSAIVFMVFFPLMYWFRNISQVNRIWITVSFLIVVVLTSNISYIDAIKNTVTNYFTIRYGFKDYSESYSVESGESLFAVGNILKIFFFSLVLLCREYVKREKNGDFIYSMTICYFFLDRFLILIPTGFRLALFLTYFYSAFVVCIFKQRIKFGYLFVFYFALAFAKNLWNSYDLIPYSNSIPYIITTHKSYYERSNNNFKAYQKRLHKEYNYRGE